MATWSCEFDGAAGSPPDERWWVAEVGGGGWGDAQLQRYTTSSDNAHLDGEGRLAIEARSGGSEAASPTSARLTTKGRLAVRYGRIAARIKVPVGSGMWPAFWMLGEDIDDVGWPQCGEIDVMEHVGSDPRAVHGTAHGPGYSGIGGGIGHRYEFGSDLADDFHVFRVDWSPASISWAIDGREYGLLRPADVPGSWPFDHHFHLLVNLAVGGAWPGNDPTGLRLPVTMLVDWVRVTDSDIRRGERGLVPG